jgi:hypothetical protein
MSCRLYATSRRTRLETADFVAGWLVLAGLGSGCKTIRFITRCLLRLAMC